jgi:hypothetical protein
MCPHATLYVSSYYCICVLILVYMWLALELIPLVLQRVCARAISFFGISFFGHTHTQTDTRTDTHKQHTHSHSHSHTLSSCVHTLDYIPSVTEREK